MHRPLFLLTLAPRGNLYIDTSYRVKRTCFLTPTPGPHPIANMNMNSNPAGYASVDWSLIHEKARNEMAQQQLPSAQQLLGISNTSTPPVYDSKPICFHIHNHRMNSGELSSIPNPFGPNGFHAGRLDNSASLLHHHQSLPLDMQPMRLNASLCKHALSVSNFGSLNKLPRVRNVMMDKSIRRKPTRFSDASCAILNDWLDTNAEYPYPTPDQKVCDWSHH